MGAIGAGGMGEVYKARDSRLDRLVAIKVLPSDKLADPERRRRFVQEAKAASALNHPNIVTIYDIGSADGVDYLAMEHVNGKTLDALTPRDGLKISDALRYAVQTADALAKAHGAGIVHRDLKPSNVMVTDDGLVKVLDFGLAKLTQPSSEARGSRGAPEGETVAATSGAGQIIGTLSYMSPEQAESRPVDFRSDIFSFGALLYEMVSGRRAFQGESAASTLSAVLRDEPKSMTELRPDTPMELQRVIKRCLRKDPARRFQTTADLKVALEELKEEFDSGTLSGTHAPAAATASRRTVRLRPALAIGAAVFGGVAAIWWAMSRRTVPADAAVHPVPLAAYAGDEAQADFSPDGNQVAFRWDGDKRDNDDIYVKLLGPGVPLRLTSHPDRDFSPRWSPDGRTIAFVRAGADGNSVMLIPALGGPERTLAKFTSRRTTVLTASFPLLSWSPNGRWLVAAGADDAGPPILYAIAVDTGERHALTSHPTASDLEPTFAGDFEPAFSPDGRSLAFTRNKGMQLSDIWVLSVSDILTPNGAARRLATDGEFSKNPAWTPDGREILYASGNPTSARISRMPADGSGPSRVIETLGDGVDSPAASRSGRRLVYTRHFMTSTVWRLDLQAGNGTPTPFIVSRFREAFPQYSPDGTRVAFYSNRGGTNQVWVCDADGTRASQLTSMTGSITGTPRWSPDGQRISFDSNSNGHWQIYVMDAGGGTPKALTNDEATNVNASWSRDGRSIYFMSSRSGDNEIWKVPSQGGSPVRVTRHGASSGAIESLDGQTLFYVKREVGMSSSSLWRMPAAGGDEERLLPSVYRYNVAVTEAGIYFDTPDRPGQPSTIQLFDPFTRKITTLFTLTKPVDLGLAVSPDRRYLLYAQNDFSGSDLMLVENFR